MDAVEVMMAVEEVRDADDLVPILYELPNFRNSPLKYLMPRRMRFIQLNKVCISSLNAGQNYILSIRIAIDYIAKTPEGLDLFYRIHPLG